MIVPLNNIENSVGGTNCRVQKATHHNTDVIHKRYGFEQQARIDINTQINALLILIRDVVKLRKLISDKGVNIPEILISYISIYDDTHALQQPTLNIIERYCGNNLKHIYTDKSNNKVIKNTITNNVIDIIKKLPEGVELDINPSNITYHNDELFFVDFIPPKIIEYQSNKTFIKLFPQVKRRVLERENRRKWRYTTTDGRVQRFLYYIGALENNKTLYWNKNGKSKTTPQQSPAQKQHVSY